jgi:integrase/recombinase XerD
MPLDLAAGQLFEKPRRRGRNNSGGMLVSSPDQQLDRYLRHVTIERGLSTNTQAAYRRDLSAYVDWLTVEGMEEMSAVTVPMVTSYLSSLTTRDETPLTSTSLSRTLSSIRGFHRFLVEEGELVQDVTTDVRRPKLPKSLPKALTIDQVVALLGAVSGDDPVAIRDRAFLEFLYATGARVSEATALNVDDVTAVDDSVRVRGKGSKQRIVPLGSYAKTAIDEYLVRVRPIFSAQGRSTPALFLGPRGARLSRQSACHRTPCVTRSRPTCLPAGQTCVLCRNCSVTHPLPPHKFIPR